MQIILTPTAVTKVQEFMSEHGAAQEAGLRVAVRSSPGAAPDSSMDSTSRMPRRATTRCSTSPA